MRPLKPLAVFVVAILSAFGTAQAEDSVLPAECPECLTQNGLVGNGYDQYRRQPDPGVPSSPAYGYHHFSGPTHAFGTWYRPRAATLTRSQRCAPDPFRPRGFGHVFARPCDPFRMEYKPYVLQGHQSGYGPAYLLRAPDPRCEHCDHSSH